MKFILAFVILSLVFSCSKSQIDHKAEGEKLMQISRNWSKTAASQNLDSVLSYWSDDAVVMQPGMPLLKGKEEIRGMLDRSTKIPGFRISWEPQSAHISECGDMAYLVENTQITVNDTMGNPVTIQNKAVTIWQRQEDGQWKAVVDIWNENE